MKKLNPIPSRLRRRSWMFALVLLLLARHPLFGQASILAAYERNFLRASLSAKINVLLDAAKDSRAPDFIGDFYEFVLQYILQNLDTLGNDEEFITLTILASRGIGASEHRASLDTLWGVFSTCGNSTVQVEVLKVLGSIGNRGTVENLNRYLANQNNIHRAIRGKENPRGGAGVFTEYPIISACISTLVVLGDSASFPVIFDVMTSGYPDFMIREAEEALDFIPGDFKSFFLEKIHRGTPEEKVAALTVGIRNAALDDITRGEMAEAALETVLDTPIIGGEERSQLGALRYTAIPVLRDLRWTRATPLVIKHFYRVQREYLAKTASREQLLDAIACLGAMGNSEAAQVLSLQLGLLNSQMEQRGNVDDAVTLGAIQALGQIGDKVAFDHLLYISYLPYPEPIQIAAKEALNRLKW